MARLVTLTLLCFALVGCELIADFDRSKIPDERPRNDGGADEDASVTDSAVGEDATIDAGEGDADAGEGDAGEGDEDAG